MASVAPVLPRLVNSSPCGMADDFKRSMDAAADESGMKDIQKDFHNLGADAREIENDINRVNLKKINDINESVDVFEPELKSESPPKPKVASTAKPKTQSKAAIKKPASKASAKKPASQNTVSRKATAPKTVTKTTKSKKTVSKKAKES